MTDIILNEEKEENDVCGEASAGAIIVATPSELERVEKNELEKVEPSALEYTKQGDVALAEKSKKKQPRALTITSLVFTSLSLACALIGLVPFQILFVALGLTFYIIDRVKNGKRGVSLFGMICTLVTFVIIAITLFYCVILLCVGIYTVYINPEPYNFVMGTVKGFISWLLGIFGINFSF